MGAGKSREVGPGDGDAGWGLAMVAGISAGRARR